MRKEERKERRKEQRFHEHLLHEVVHVMARFTDKDAKAQRDEVTFKLTQLISARV